MEQMHGKTVEDCELDISLAKPQTDQKQKKKMGVKRGGPPMGKEYCVLFSLKFFHL